MGHRTSQSFDEKFPYRTKINGVDVDPVTLGDVMTGLAYTDQLEVEICEHTGCDAGPEYEANKPDGWVDDWCPECTEYLRNANPRYQVWVRETRWHNELFCCCCPSPKSGLSALMEYYDKEYKGETIYAPAH